MLPDSVDRTQSCISRHLWRGASDSASAYAHHLKHLKHADPAGLRLHAYSCRAVRRAAAAHMSQRWPGAAQRQRDARHGCAPGAAPHYAAGPRTCARECSRPGPRLALHAQGVQMRSDPPCSTVRVTCYKGPDGQGPADSDPKSPSPTRGRSWALQAARDMDGPGASNQKLPERSVDWARRQADAARVFIAAWAGTPSKS
jgi:hypothetical protein